MNKQTGSNAIEWCDYTHNPIGGCEHGCRWRMPDGSIADCYAETTAEGIARAAYPQGFAYHYWKPNKLKEPLSVKQPSRIFVGSMSDLFGANVPTEQIEMVLDVCRQAHWHQFQVLTKNAPRLKKFKFPPNVWVGASVPPTFMHGKELRQNQQWAMMAQTLDTLAEIDAPVRWMSIEPLSWDVSEILRKHGALQWAVIGAASRGRNVFQPDPAHVQRAITVLDDMGARVFFKGNLRGNAGYKEWREEFPTVKPVAATKQMGLAL